MQVLRGYEADLRRKPDLRGVVGRGFSNFIAGGGGSRNKSRQSGGLE
jgi:hypothetical protein